MASTVLGQPLDDPPGDGITALRFSATSDLLMATSWDGTARLYDAGRRTLRGSYSQVAPALDGAFQDDSVVYVGGLDGLVRRYDFFTRTEMVLGEHERGVRCVEWLAERGALATGSWDATLRVWDPRLPPGQNCTAMLSLPGRVFSMAQSGSRLVVATSGRHVLIYDLRALEAGRPEQERESSLKFQTRCVRCFPDATGFALSSVEGRVAMEYFDPSNSAQAKKYAFKCHRRSEGGRDTVYPVNAIAFAPFHGTFATGGCDGVVNMWDGENKKRLCQISAYPTSVAALAFSRDGRTLAVASSYTYEQGEQAHAPDAIYLRPMSDAETRPKKPRAAA
ncbi:hypothetical protein WJX81_003316 [Elliptochloris bilobata]|uniref:Mitotic checkpoint protein BUB3 n=1 Tax=Elliptochloris bilobata TaxID=381761 RepID=A0AAW1SJR2_9CHLO